MMERIKVRSRQGLGTNNYIIDICPALAYTRYYI